MDIQYNKNIAKANKNWENDLDRRDLHYDHPKGSLKTQWFFRHPSRFLQGSSQSTLLPQVRSGLILTLICTGSQWDFSTQIKWLMDCQRRSLPTCKHTSSFLITWSLVLYLRQMRSSETRRKDAIKIGEWLRVSSVVWIIMKAAQFYYYKQQMASRERQCQEGQGNWICHQQGNRRDSKSYCSCWCCTSLLKTLEDDLLKANEIMQTMANHHVMSMAPSEIQEQYFTEEFDLVNAQARNKHQHLQRVVNT